MYTYQVCLVNPHCLYETTLNVKLDDLYVYPVRLVNSRCLHMTNLRVKAIVSVYLPNPPSQLGLFVRDNSFS